MKRKNKVSAEFNMSSLTDIIFLLLIFFMLTSTLVAPNALNLKLPSSNKSTSVEPSGLDVTITRAGTYKMAGKTVSASSVRSKIRSQIQKKGNPQKVTLTITPEKGATVQSVVTILDMARILQVNTILATDQD